MNQNDRIRRARGMYQTCFALSVALAAVEVNVKWGIHRIDALSWLRLRINDEFGLHPHARLGAEVTVFGSALVLGVLFLAAIVTTAKLPGQARLLRTLAGPVGMGAPFAVWFAPGISYEVPVAETLLGAAFAIPFLWCPQRLFLRFVVFSMMHSSYWVWLFWSHIPNGLLTLVPVTAFLSLVTWAEYVRVVHN